jgi:hypothetical protein
MNFTDLGHLTDDADEGEDKLEVAAEKEGKSAREIADFYIKSFFLSGRLSYSLIKQKRFDLYIAGAFGIKRIDKYLLDEKEVETEIIKEITLIGFQYKILNKTLVMAELTNGDIALIKFGLTYRL